MTTTPTGREVEPAPEAARAKLQPLAACISIDDQDKASLRGFKCSNCGVVLLDRSRGCPNCAAVGTLDAMTLAPTGKLYTYTIVYRSYPGVVTPFVSAVVALDGGGFIKGNLVGVDPVPEALPFDMPVRVEFERIKPVDGEPVHLLRYVFVPTTPASSAQ
jgi:uncharacterized OB-fold protein